MIKNRKAAWLFLGLLSFHFVPKAQAFELSEQTKVILGLYSTVAITAIMAKVLAPQLKKALAKHKVGVITIHGTISESSVTVQELRNFFQDPAIDAIVVKINSGGGAPGASQCIYQAINELRTLHPKPIVSWVEEIACSGAYYIAAATDAIIAAPSAIVGSVGVIMEVGQYKEFLAQYKIDHKFITAGEYKATGHSFDAMTKEQESMLHNMCSSIYKRFVKDVQTGRSDLAEKDPKIWANGKIFDAETALELGLVDALGSQLTVEKVLKKLTKKDAAITWFYPSKTIKNFFGQDLVQENNTPYITSAVDTICQRVQMHMDKSMQAKIELKV